MMFNINIFKRFKYYLFIITSYLFFFLIGDLIFSNFIYKDKLDIRYNCYEHKNIIYNNKTYHDYFFIKNCEATESQKTAAPYKVLIDQDGYRFSGNKRLNENNNLIFLGDSTTYGVGSKFENTFVGIVEKKMRNYNVYNLAIPGFGLQKYYFVLNQFLKTKTVSKIFITIDMTDILDAANRWVNIPNYPSPVLESAFVTKEISNWKNIQNSYFKGTRLMIFHLRNFIRTIKIKIKQLDANNKNISSKTKTSDWANFTYTNKEDLTISEEEFENAKLIIENYFEKINLIAKKNEAKVYLIIFPWPENLIYGQEKFNWENFNYELCKTYNCSGTINLFQEFRKIMKENDNWQNLIYIKDDIHFTNFGNNLIAENIVKIMEN